MIIKTQLTKKDFIKLNFALLYRKPVIIFFTVFILIIFLTSLAGLILSAIDTSAQLMISFTMLIFMPLITYINSIRNFSTSSRIAEPFEYSFEESQLAIRGESFKAELAWSNVYQVTLLKRWLLVWQNKQLANPILRKDIAESQLPELKRLLDGVKVKNNL